MQKFHQQVFIVSYLLKRQNGRKSSHLVSKEITVSLLRKIKKSYYKKLDEKEIIDKKKFWKTVKPYLSDKSVNSDKINVNEKGELMQKLL